MKGRIFEALKKYSLKDVFFNAKENKRLSELRFLPSYQRLRNKYEKFPIGKGVDNFGFTIGDIPDVADLYNRCCDISDISHTLGNIKRIASDFTDGKTIIPDFEKKLSELIPARNLKIDNPIRNLKIDIKAILTQNDRELYTNEITHYPGGLNIERFDVSSYENGYCILFANRHSYSNNKYKSPVNKIFLETGIPMRS